MCKCAGVCVCACTELIESAASSVFVVVGWLLLPVGLPLVDRN